MTDEERLESLKRQLQNHEGSLLLIDEQISKYVLETDVPLQLKRDREGKAKLVDHLREQIETLTATLQQANLHAANLRGLVFTASPQRNSFAVSSPLHDTAQPVAPPEFSFVAGPPITHPRHFFGRTKVVKKIFSQWKTLPLQNVAIIGAKRTGKTSLLHLCEQLTRTPKEMLRPGQRNDLLPAPEQYRWLFLDFQNPRLTTQEGWMTYVLQQLGFPVPAPCTMTSFTETMIAHLQQPTILLMDEVGVAIEKYADLDPDFWTGLRSLATNFVGGRLGFVVAAHSSPMRLAKQVDNSSPFFNIFGLSIKLGPVEDEEARELLACSPIPFTEDDIAWLLAQSGRWPILLQILARERLAALEDGDESGDWKEEGIEQIQPFAHLLNPASA